VILPPWNSDEAATVQAIAAIAQGLLTVVALAIAIGVPMWQQRRVRQDGKKNRADELAGLRHALHTEVGMVGLQCLIELYSWLKVERPTAVKNPRTARLPPLTIYNANAAKIGLLTRAEIVPLVGFSGTLHDIFAVADDMTLRGLQGPEARETLQILLSDACGNVADFLEIVPGIEGSDRDRQFISELRAAFKQMDPIRMKMPPSFRHSL
jgi:hypothetical protein